MILFLTMMYFWMLSSGSMVYLGKPTEAVAAALLAIPFCLLGIWFDYKSKMK